MNEVYHNLSRMSVFGRFAVLLWALLGETRVLGMERTPFPGLINATTPPVTGALGVIGHCSRALLKEFGSSKPPASKRTQAFDSEFLYRRY